MITTILFLIRIEYDILTIGPKVIQTSLEIADYNAIEHLTKTEYFYLKIRHNIEILS